MNTLTLQLGFKSRKIALTILSISSLISFQTVSSQQYRTAKAYINDFGQNEIFITSALNDYSKSIAYMDSKSRVSNTSKELIFKLEKLNIILTKTDKGFDGDTSLRNALLNLNIAVISFLRNNSNNLNDYKEQSLLSLNEINKNFEQKEKDINNLYGEFKNYEMTKKMFGLKNNIPIKNHTGKNIFEYNSKQNLIFYKLNVLDEKLQTAINSKDLKLTQDCSDLIVKTSNEALVTAAFYKDYFKDNSLNNANVILSEFYINQNEILIPIVTEYFLYQEKFQKIKSEFDNNNQTMTIEAYNEEVRKINSLKNKYYNTLNSINIKKNATLNNWYVVNSEFLKNNINFETIDYKYVDSN